MITIAIKDFFFDRDRVVKAVDKAKIAVQSKAGAFVRQRAQTSMRWAPLPGEKISKRMATRVARAGWYSKPGNPPYAHRRTGGLLRKLLFFGYDPSSDSVVIGPVRAKRGIVPNLHEFGGTARAKGRTVIYPPRPFMAPALEAEEPKLPSYWRNTVRGET